jgi:hypothetical protein
MEADRDAPYGERIKQSAISPIDLSDTIDRQRQ